MLLNAVRIQVNTENTPTRTFKDGSQQVATNKTTATHKGYGDRSIVKFKGRVQLLGQLEGAGICALAVLL